MMTVGPPPVTALVLGGSLLRGGCGSIPINRPWIHDEAESQTHSSRSTPRTTSKNSASCPLDLMRTALLPR